MCKSLLFFLSLVFFSFSNGQPQPPFQLLVEYMPSPVYGVDVPNPRFFWALSHSNRAVVQSAYQIQVALDYNFVTFVWDTNQYKSSATSQIPYQGKPLQSDTSYYWRVRWWDGNGIVSNWSSVAQMDTGLFNVSDWGNAQWITGYNLLRTEFQIFKPVARARAYICGLGYYELRLNGRKIGDQSLGTFTTFEQRVLYDTYDVTYQIQQQNAIGVMLGRGWYTLLGVGPLSLIFMLSVQFTDGTSTQIVSNTNTWTTAPGPIISDDIYIGETYDARLEQPGWDFSNFDDSNWSSPNISQGIYGVLSSQMNPPIKKTLVYSPLSITEPKPGVYVFDFGQNVAGFVRLTVQGPRGGTITLYHDEELNPDGTLHHLYPNSPEVDKYILKGGGVEVYEPRFTYHGFQYVQLTSSWGYVPNMDSLQSIFVHTALPEIGEIVFGENILNQIQRALRFASRSNFMNIPTDCPQRERRGWMGDAQLSAETIIHNWDMSAAYTKWIRDIRDSQLFYMNTHNGHVPDCVPFYDHGSLPSDPAWGTAYTLIWNWMYKYYGDIRILQQYYDGVKSYINALYSQSNKNTSALEFSIYGDWCAVPQGMNSGCAYPSPLTSTFYFLLELETFSKVASLLNQGNDATYYKQIADLVRNQWDENFYHYDKGYQTSQILSLWSGLVRPNERNRIITYLLNDIVSNYSRHLDTGIVGTKYVLPFLSSIGRTDLAYIIATQTTFPSWGYMVLQGATTLWENWQSSTYVSYGSKNHIMFGGHGVWYFQTIAGINMPENAVAFEEVIIHPLIDQIPLSQASASIQTQKGQIYSSWYYPSFGLCQIVDENSVITFTCAQGNISKIDFASFGTPQGNCPNPTYGHCNAGDSLSIVSKLCLGKTSCSILASDSVFGDPCPGTMKQLAVKVSGICDFPEFAHEVTLPPNTKGSFFISKFGMSNVQILEGSTTIWNTGGFIPGVPGIRGAVDHGTEIEFFIGSGSYIFYFNGEPPLSKCVTLEPSKVEILTCPKSHYISKINFASFGAQATGTCGSFQHGSCYAGSSKHVIENLCLLKEECKISSDPELFGGNTACGHLEDRFLTVEYSCAI